MSDYKTIREMRKKLENPRDWDIPNLIAYVRGETFDRADEAVAVIDVLMEAMADIAKLIHHKHAKRIDCDTIAKAANIAGRFVREPQKVRK